MFSRITVVCLFLLTRPVPAEAGDLHWPQFRGPLGSGVSDGEKLPVQFGPEKGVVWSAPLPPGISSPVVVGKRIFVTAFRDDALWTLALNRSTGQVLWERRAPVEKMEAVQSSSSPAASTPTCDGERLVVFFGSCGLLAYDTGGNDLWRLPLGPFNTTYGVSSSPILAGPLVIFNCDQDMGSFLIAVDKRTGKIRYRVERPRFLRGFSTPLFWDEGDIPKIVVAGTLAVQAYALDDGRELWTADGLARIAIPSPFLGEGLLFVSTYAPGGDSTDRIVLPPFNGYLKENDANGDGRLSTAEVPPGQVKIRLSQFDADKDEFLSRWEWESMAAVFVKARNGIVAFRSEGKNNVSLVWKHEKAIPYVTTPLCYRGHIYLIKNGGILTVLSASTGEVKRMERVPARGTYYSSPVAGDGKVYLANLRGEVVVLSAGPDWKVLATTSLGDRCAATPAIAGGCLYYRTNSRLFCFGAGAKEK